MTANSHRAFLYSWESGLTSLASGLPPADGDINKTHHLELMRRIPLEVGIVAEHLITSHHFHYNLIIITALLFFIICF